LAAGAEHPNLTRGVLQLVDLPVDQWRETAHLALELDGFGEPVALRLLPNILHRYQRTTAGQSERQAK
jgi:hypothetical protein